MLEFSKEQDAYLNKQSVLEYVKFFVGNSAADVDNAIEGLNYNFTQFFEYCKTMGAVRPYKKDYMD